MAHLNAKLQIFGWLRPYGRIVIAGLVVVAACGKPNFSGQSGRSGSADSNGESAEGEGRGEGEAEGEGSEGNHGEVIGAGLGGNEFEWFWQCESAPVPLPDSLSNGRTLVQGKGSHTLAKPIGAKWSVHISGLLCPGNDSKRDIVVVVDVSGSTGGVNGSGTDPVTFGPFGTPDYPLACERKKAVKALMGQLSKNAGANVGFVTFSSDVKFSSSTLLPATTMDESTYGGDELCAADGGTNYADALLRAGALLDGGRPEAAKEIYFITDGMPSSIERSREVSAAIRKKAVIATIMFGEQNPDHLRNEVASTDPSGKPIHATVTNAKDLAATLELLSKSIPKKGTYKYKPRAAQKWLEADLWPYVKDGVFDIPSLALDSGEYESGISFSFTYEDNRGAKVVNEGDFVWK